MAGETSIKPGQRACSRCGTGGSVVTFVLGGLTGAALLWGFLHMRATVRSTPAELAIPVRSVLESLPSPVAVHLYLGLEDPGVPESDRAFARRVEQLLDAMVRHADGRLVVERHTVVSPEDQTAAAQAGLEVFHLDKGAVAFLGVIVEGPGGRKVLSRLDPAWEPALAFDLARAMAEVAQVRAGPAAGPPVEDPQTLAEVRQVLGEPAGLSREEGADRLREAALEEFRRTVQEFQQRQEELQRWFREAEQRGDAATQQALLEQLRRLQLEQTQALQQLAERLQARLDVWQRLKPETGFSGGPPATNALGNQPTGRSR